MHDLIVVGAGAAGLWAAVVAASRGLRVLVLEKNVKPGVKILISGGTRCNITHACGPQQIVDAFGDQGRFLKPSVFALPPRVVVQRFNEWGVPTKTEDTGKVFPASDRALHVRDALVKQLHRSGAILQTGVAVRDLLPSSEGCPLQGSSTEGPSTESRWRIITETHTLHCRNVLLCSGGLSYPGCGTTGDGYQWARRAGHSIVPTFPALAPLVSPANWVHELTGITLPDVTVRMITGDGKEKDARRSCRSSFLWTHFGCSGPAPMNVSRYVEPANLIRLEEPELGKAVLEIDLLPEWSEAQMLEQFDPGKYGKRRVNHLLCEWIPGKLAERLLVNAGVDGSCVLAELPKRAKQRLVTDLKRLAIPIDGTRGYSKAEVTRGGISTREVDPRTLESRLAPGLYLAGEILDIDGPIGGYNFQAAFATANAAAMSMR